MTYAVRPAKGDGRYFLEADNQAALRLIPVGHLPAQPTGLMARGKTSRVTRLKQRQHAFSHGPQMLTHPFFGFDRVALLQRIDDGLVLLIVKRSPGRRDGLLFKLLPSGLIADLGKCPAVLAQQRILGGVEYGLMKLAVEGFKLGNGGGGQALPQNFFQHLKVVT